MGLHERALEAAAEQTEDEKKLAAHVRQTVEECRASASRVAHEGIWMTNIAYLLGYDGVKYNTQTRSFQPINRAGAGIKKNRTHVNKILPTIQNRLARLAKNPPKYDIPPESNSTDDKDAARLGLQILGTLWNKLKINEKRLFLLMWVQQCGHAYVKVLWDDEAGKPMVDPMTNELAYEGEVGIEVTSPFEMFPDAMAKSFDDALKSHITQAKVRKLDYFKRYPRGHLVKEEPAWLLSSQYEQRINTMNSRGPSEGNDSMKNCAIELVKYEARSNDYPNGRMIVVANGILLEDKELPVGEIPFAKFDDVIIGGKYNSESTITHLRPLQDSYNEAERRIEAWVRKYLAGKYVAPRDTGLTQESMTNDEDEIVYYTPSINAPNGGEPKAIAVPALPQWAFQRKESIDKDFNDISGISEVSRGTLPSASIPAIGMQLLTEQDDTRIGVMTEQHEHAWARVGTLILKYVEEFYKLPRKLKVAGKNLEYTVKEIRGSDLRGNTEVTVIRGSTLPGSKTLSNQEILNRFDRGLLGDPKDPKVIEKVNAMTEFGDVAEGFVDYGLDMAQIKRGIEKLEAGEPLLVDELDNHPLWIQELNRYRKGDKFESLAPELQDIFKQTIEQHIQAIMKMSNVPEQDPDQPEPPMGGALPDDPAADPMLSGTDPSEASQQITPEMAGGF